MSKICADFQIIENQAELYFVLLRKVLRFLFMKIKILAIISLLTVSAVATCQSTEEINKTDQLGRKQGHWIKKYQNGNLLYDGIFRDNHPVGEFKRYNEDKTLKSVLVYSPDGNEVDATIYHPNGFIASQGKYINQLKEGKWKFYTMYLKEHLICEEAYSKNLRNGLSVKFYPDNTVAEKTNYVNGRKEGEWLQYHENGKLFLKTSYSGDKLNGKFEVWYDDGKPQISGAYKNNLRDGTWRIYKKDGTQRYVLNYISGVTKDHQIDIDASNLIDSLELNKGKIPDPEKTEVIRP
jgi:antitoxin component YwqK of YwqJK toxin-antitoxin module